MKVYNNKYDNSDFENIKHLDDYGNEYWYARELQKVLEYKRCDKFINVIENSKIACKKVIILLMIIFPKWEKW